MCPTWKKLYSALCNGEEFQTPEYSPLEPGFYYPLNSANGDAHAPVVHSRGFIDDYAARQTTAAAS
ncbi:MAG: hypothetical protein COB37_02910 [Kordiimonadales bacterium]|nr:MAG: hypothetical protein COB37_02910 [Kordiimonadales bacterium]